MSREERKETETTYRLGDSGMTDSIIGKYVYGREGSIAENDKG